ncbi:thiamine phosphate synthase [Dyella sp. KRB-257]|uniref:thiamine phosphate synthase n=1 Tax=Dyella sp. KRB-257 TaxID=3400915 RepID=UPI003C0B88D3
MIGHHAERMSTLPRNGIYAITDGQPHRLLARTEQALAGGVAMIQYRDLGDDHPRRFAEATALAVLCARYGRPLIIDHDIALAQAVGAAGVHLGQAEGDPAAARAVLGSQSIVGMSCYASTELAVAAARAGASYVSFGAFFPSPTKPQAGRARLELLRQTATLGIARVAIGGITPDNGRSLVDAGADFIATVSAVFGAHDTRAAAANLAALFTA